MAEKKISVKIKTEIEEYIEILKKNKLPIKKVYLFGSFAHGKPHKWSDIDLCIVSPKFKDPLKAMQYLLIKRQKDDMPAIEPIGFSPKDFENDMDPLISEIKKTGIEIPV